MKIKTVCEITGLTSRAVRVYIEEGLIFPEFKENYLGHRSFDFSQNDIEILNCIAVLRKVDFSIEEIRQIINNEESSVTIIQNVKSRIEQQVLSSKERLKALSCVENGKSYTIKELAEVLEQASNKLPSQNESVKNTFLTGVKSTLIFIIVWFPFALAIVGTIISMGGYAYPVVSIKAILVLLLTLLPSIMVIVLPKIKIKYKAIINKALLLACVISIPFSFVSSISIVSHSQTSNFINYREFDPGCFANRDAIFQEFFPTWPHYFEDVEQENGQYETIYLDATYYYYYLEGFDYTYDIYAQWPLDRDMLDSEIERVRAVFEDVINQNHIYKLVKLKKGSYTCLVLYNGEEPFSQVTANYKYYIFAYDETNGIVRYICCDSLENGEDQPYYLQLDW